MKLRINGKELEVPEVQTMLELLSVLEIKTDYTAVALNQEFLPRSRYREAKIQPMDEIEILQPMQGG